MSVQVIESAITHNPDSGVVDVEARRAILAHISTRIGPIAGMFEDTRGERVRLDIVYAAPTEERPFFTLCTLGMSDFAMPTPLGAEQFAYSELLLCLPPDWPIWEPAKFLTERYYWPFQWLTLLGRMPQMAEMFLSFGHVIPNGIPPQPLAEDIGMAGFILFEPRSFKPADQRLVIRPDKAVNFFGAVPLYPDELRFERQDHASFIEAMYMQNLDELLHPGRRCLRLPKRRRLF